MFHKTKSLQVLLVAAFLLGSAGYVSSESESSESDKVVSYIRTWGLGSTREEINQGKYWKAEDIKADKVTTLNIAFAVIKKDDKNFDITIRNLAVVDGAPAFKNLFEELAKLQKKYPKTRFNLSVGGWGADGFSDMALTAESRAEFIANVLKWVKLHKFNGVDIDWEYPVNGGWGAIKSRPEDKPNFTLLLKELRAALDNLGEMTKQKYEISFAGGAAPDFVNKWIEAGEVAKYVDYVKIMSYDFAGPWSAETGHHANLYSYAVGDKKFDLSADTIVNNYIKAGFPEQKILLGIPFYGRGWKDVPNVNHGLGQKLGKEKGVYADGITYPDIMKLMKKDSNFKRYWDDVAKVPYIYNGNVFITYEDEQSISEKIKYVKDKGLRGLMIWEYSQDMSAELLTHINKEIK